MASQTHAVHGTTVRDILFIVFSKRYILLAIFLTFVFLTNLLSFVVDPVFEASGTILLKPKVENEFLAGAAMARMEILPVTERQINSEIEILNSRELLAQVVEEMKSNGNGQSEKLLSRILEWLGTSYRQFMIRIGLSIPPNPLDKAIANFRARLKVSSVTMSDMVRVTLSGKDPGNIAKAVNVLLEKYIDRHIDVYRAKGNLKFFAEQAQYFHDKLRQAEQTLAEFQKKAMIIDANGQKTAHLDLLKAMRQSLMAVRGQLIERQTRFQTVKKSILKDGRLEALTEEFRTNQMIVDLSRALVPLVLEQERIALLYPRDSVEYKDASNQAENIRDSIRKELKRTLDGVEIDLAALASQDRLLAREVARIEAEGINLATSALTLNQLIREAKQYEKNYLLYRDKTEEARISEQKEANRVANVSVASWAYVPSIPIFPKRLLLAALSLFMGVFAGLAGVFASYRLDHTIKRPEDLLNYCGVPILASLELMKPARLVDQSGRRGLPAPKRGPIFGLQALKQLWRK